MVAQKPPEFRLNVAILSSAKERYGVAEENYATPIRTRDSAIPAVPNNSNTYTERLQYSASQVLPSHQPSISVGHTPHNEEELDRENVSNDYQPY